MPYHNLPHQEMIAKSAAVAQALTPELYAYILSLLPTPQSYAEMHERYEASFAGSLKGDSEKVKLCEEFCDALKKDLAVIAGVAKAVSHKDPTVPGKLALGQLVERGAGSATIPGDAKDFEIYFDRKGRQFAKLSKITGAKGYEIWSCDGDPSVESNWRLLVWSTGCQKIALPAMNRSKVNFLKVRGKGSKGVGPWSNVISLDPA